MESVHMVVIHLLLSTPSAGMIAIGVCIVLLLVIGFCNRKKVS